MSTPALDYIHNISWQGSRLGLSRIQELLSKLGDPQKKLRFVHVAGTNGKGSACAMIESVLRASGYKTGLYTSPYINHFHERIRVNGMEISDTELEEITAYIRPFAEQMDDPPTEFELITAIAMEYFIRCSCDIVVLEVGLGGELDSTNVIDPPEIAVITAIGMDHTRELGSAIADIAKAKAGILKGGSAVAFGGQPEADTVLKVKAAQTGTRLKFVDFSELSVRSIGLNGCVMDFGNLKNIRLPLAGTYQPQNAALAISALDGLRSRGWQIPDDAVKRGLETVSWPGRFEILTQKPLFILDGAHNPQGMESFAKSVRALCPGQTFHTVLGVMADKELDAMLAQISPLTSVFYTVAPNNPRAMEAAALAKKTALTGVPAIVCESIDTAVQRAIEAAGPDGAACALGSLYFSFDIRKAVQAYFHVK